MCIIANTTFAYAQTAAILPPAYTTFLDANGHPLTAGQVFFYIPSTTTPKTTWQDAAETIPNTNPVILDAAGKALILGSGSYRQIVQDQLGNTIWDQVTASPGGSGGGGGTATGDGDLVGTIKPWAGPVAPNQYMFTYGQQISRTTFAALFSAITSVQAIFCNTGSSTLSGLSDTTNFWIGMTVEVSCVSGGVTTVISKTSSTVNLAVNANITTSTNATFFMWGNGNGVTTFTLPDFRGFNLAGNCLMGGVACSNLTTPNFGSQTPNGSGAAGGNQTASITLTAPNIPSITSTLAGTVTGTLNSNVVEYGGVFFGSVQSGSGGGISFNSSPAIGEPTVSVPLAAGTATSNNTGTTPYVTSIIQPTKTVNYIIKVTPDVNSTIASGVTSLGLMTGSIACGSGLVCTGNNVSVNVTSVNLTSGVSGITSGVNNGVLWDNAGVLNVTTTLPTGLTAPAFTITGSLTATGLVTNADLVNQSTTVNGQTCTLGSTCTISASAGTITVGTTTVASSTTTDVLFNNGGILGNYAITGTGSVVMSVTPTLTGIPVLGAPTATSIALGGATIGGNALAVTGTSLFNTAVTMGAALTYGGVTLSNAVTGTGNMVLSTSPTIAGPTISAPVLSGTVTGTYTIGGTPSIAGSAINSGTISGSFMSASNLASSSNGGVTGVLPTANGGTGSATIAPARVNLNIDEATSTGDANYVILSTDRMVYHTALSTARTDTLPAANSVNAGQVFIVNDFAGVATASKTITLQKTGSDTINGVSSVVAINAQYGAAIFWSDGTSRWTFFPIVSASASGTVTDVIIAGGNGITVSGTCNITVSGTCTVNASVPIPQGRLTLAANTPVMGATSCSGSPCANISTLRYDCFIGQTVPYYNGTNDLIDTITSCEFTDAMVSAASAGQVVSGQVYDVWWVHGGTNRICIAMSASTGGGGGWAQDTAGSNTARGTGFSQLDYTTRGYITNKNSIANCFNGATNYGSISANQGTYLGTIYATANGQTTYQFGSANTSGQNALFGVYNAYNQKDVVSAVQDTTTSWTYTVNSFRQARASTSNQIQYIDGLGTLNVQSIYGDDITASASSSCLIGIGIDTLTANSGKQGFVSTGSSSTDVLAIYTGVPGFGLHTIAAIEKVSANTFTCTYFGGTNLYMQLSATLNGM